MKARRPGVIATRAVNQYRKRDVIAFLGVRHLLKSSAAQSDRWAQEIAGELVRNRAAPAYFFSHHFKAVEAHGAVNSRQIAIPSPIEVLAETALLAECAEQRAFRNPSCVFTYQLAASWDRSGSFVNYSNGLRARQKAIAAACDASPGGVVRYLDIRKFYPSIRTEDAEQAWRKAAHGLRVASRDLGLRMLHDYSVVAGTSSRGLLTGPMFSHLIANLVMRDLDEWASRTLSVGYFRYVDDITLVGSPEEVKKAEVAIASRLGYLELELHGEDSSKSMRVSVDEWLCGRNDFEDEDSNLSWMRLIGNLKTFLVLHPDQREALHRAFLDVGMKMPIIDYSTAAFEHSSVEALWFRLQRSWLLLRSREISIRSLIGLAESLRNRFHTELHPLLDSLALSNGYQRKRIIPKVRFRTGRLIYLSDDIVLQDLADVTDHSPDLQLHGEVMKAAASGDVSKVLSMGSNAVQSAAQPLRASKRSVTFDVPKLTDVELQGLAILNFNGVSTQRKVTERQASASGDLLRVSEDAVDLELMNSIDPFVRELSCLAGFGSERHSLLLESAFDEADELVLDAVDRLDESLPHNL